MERYFIRNCLGQVVGNPKGYTTYKGANMIFNRKTMQAALIDLAHENGVEGSSTNSVLIGSIKLESTDKKIQVVRVEDSQGWGMYRELWFACDLPNDSRHPTVGSDSLYQTNLKNQLPTETWEPRGHRFGFLNLTMLRRWIYNDKWIESMDRRGAILCTYEVPEKDVIIGRTQVTFDHEKSVCISRKPLASLLEQA